MKNFRITDHILKILPVDFLLVSFLIYFFIFARNKVQGYFLQAQMFYPKVLEVTNLIQSQNEEGLLALNNLVNTIGPITNKAMTFIYVIVPLVLFLAFVLSQSYVLALLKGKKYGLKAIRKYALLHLLPFIFLISFVISLVENLGFVLPELGGYNSSFIVFGILFLLTSYIATVQKTLDVKLEKSFKKSLSFKLFLAYIPFLVLIFIVAGIAFNIYALLITGIFRITGFAILLILFLFILELYRTFYFRLISN